MAFQPNSTTTFDALDVVARDYQATTAIVPGAAAPTAFLLLSAPNTALGLMTDDAEQIWVSASGGTSTAYVVLARKP